MNSSPKRILTGKGFFVTLAVCLAAVGVVGWFALFGRNTASPHEAEHQVPEMQPSEPAESSAEPETAADDGDGDSEPAQPVQTAETEPAQAIEPVQTAEEEQQVMLPETPVEVETIAVTEAETVNEEAAGEELTAPALVVSPLSGVISAVFSVDELQYNATLDDWRVHDGVDIAAAQGTAVLSACDGTVVSVEDDPMMGATVVIRHSGGYETTYANLQSVPTVSDGDTVTAGQVIGAVGSTAAQESADGPHLHFAVTKDGTPIDPEVFLGKQTEE